MKHKQRRADGKGGAPARPDRAAEAERLHRQVMESGDAFAIHEFGVLAHAKGRSDVAAQAIARAVALNDGVPSFHYNLALALRAQGRLEEAAASYGRALALKPDYAEAHNNLGNVLAALGRREEALGCFMQALAHKPGFAQSHYSLGNLLCELGRPEDAAAHFHACLQNDPADSLGVKMLLARLGAGAAPERASAAQLENIYAERAHGWDRDAQYRGDALVAEALRRFAPGGGLDILDAGCGTGRTGALVRDLARRLDGVDLSAAMLERAAEKHVYDGLTQGDMIGYMAEKGAGYDAIASAAALIHFGDLAPVFRAAAQALRDGGLFVFTLFPKDGGEDFAVAPDPELARGACYVHRQDYVDRLAGETGFRIEMLATAQQERDAGGAPRTALIGVLRRKDAAPG